MSTRAITVLPALRQPDEGRIPASTATKAYLVFMVGGEDYACSIDEVEHVLRLADTQLLSEKVSPMPWEMGYLELRNEKFLVYSLRALWNLPSVPATGREAILIVRLPNQTFGLLVDDCRCIIPSLPSDVIQFPLPYQLRGARGAALDTVIFWQESLLITVQPARLLSSEFETLAPMPEVSSRL